MMRAHTMVSILAVFLLAGCGRTEVTQPAPPPPPLDAAAAQAPEQATRAAEIANAIAADPARAEAILQEHGMTLEAYEAMLYEVAADPTLAAAYTRSRK